jgi:hypothetical protein
MLGYADVTHITENGRQKAHPFLVSMGWIPAHLRTLDKAWAVVGMLPILHASKAVKSTTGFAAFSKKVSNTCLSKLLHPLKAVQREGGMYIRVAGGGLVLAAPERCCLQQITRLLAG